ncbi:MAG: hypothetical protein IKJ56_11810, partial [Bacteroidales bacterium]|nr:hypothetical protein [Bacteroidales bacterium]
GLRTFLGLAYAELKVNFVEGFAVLCLRRLSLRCFNGLRTFLGFNGCAVSMASLFEWLRRLSGIICLLSR